MAGVLDGVRVLDLSRILAGPWATQMLADMGASVLKIERPGVGDDTRTWGPPFLEDGDGKRDAAYFMAANRGKQSVTLDFTKPEGKALLLKLVAECDVLVENFKVGGLAKHGLDYESIKAVNPRIIYCSITGFGQTGPYAKRAGYDFMIQGMGGLMSITGAPDADGGGPVKVGVAVADVFTGLYASNAILGALVKRGSTGQGQHIDMSLLDCQVAILANQAMNYLVSGSNPTRMGNAHPNIVPYQAFACADGHLILAVGNDGQFRQFCEAAGRPEIAADSRFANNPGRVSNREALIELIGEIMLTRSRDDWISLLETAGVPCGPINELGDVFADRHVRSREMQLDLPHAQFGTVPSVANPIRYSETPIDYGDGPPALGQHTADVLSGLLGLSEEELKSLQEAKVI